MVSVNSGQVPAIHQLMGFYKLACIQPDALAVGADVNHNRTIRSKSLLLHAVMAFRAANGIVLVNLPVYKSAQTVTDGRTNALHFLEPGTQKNG